MHDTYTGAYHTHLYIPYTHIHTAYIYIYTTYTYTHHKCIYNTCVHMPYIQIHGTHTCIYHVHLHIHPLITLPEHYLLPCPAHTHTPLPRCCSYSVVRSFVLSEPPWTPVNLLRLCSPWSVEVRHQWSPPNSHHFLLFNSSPVLCRMEWPSSQGRWLNSRRSFQAKGPQPFRPSSSFIIIKMFVVPILLP